MILPGISTALTHSEGPAKTAGQFTNQLVLNVRSKGSFPANGLFKFSAWLLLCGFKGKHVLKTFEGFKSQFLCFIG